MYRPVDPDPVPTRLQATAQWVCWRTTIRDGQDKPTKVPINPETGTYASTADPDTWTGFGDAYRYYRATAAIDGIGFVFTATDPYVGADLDDCRDPDTGALDDWAHDIVQQLDSYTETSPSGTGVHILLEGQLPDGRNRTGDLELYDRDRYFTVTGDHLSLTPSTIAERTAALTAVHDDYLAATEAASPDSTPVDQPDTGTDELSDTDIIRLALDAANGDKFADLWRGDTGGYQSHSEADQALCNLLAFWTGGDPHRVERLFNQSGLVREKWQEREDYRERTIQKAIRDCTDFYNP